MAANLIGQNDKNPPISTVLKIVSQNTVAFSPVETKIFKDSKSCPSLAVRRMQGDNGSIVTDVLPNGTAAYQSFTCHASHTCVMKAW